MWCVDVGHIWRDCADFTKALRNNVMYLLIGQVHTSDTRRLLKVNTGRGGMKALMEEVRGEYLVLARPAPRLPGPLLLQLLEHCAVRGDIAGADRVLKPLIAAGGGPRAGQALLRLARVATPEKARGYQALAARHFS